jgi:hypothetical protein
MISFALRNSIGDNTMDKIKSKRVIIVLIDAVIMFGIYMYTNKVDIALLSGINLILAELYTGL